MNGILDWLAAGYERRFGAPASRDALFSGGAFVLSGLITLALGLSLFVWSLTFPIGSGSFWLVRKWGLLFLGAGVLLGIVGRIVIRHGTPPRRVFGPIAMVLAALVIQHLRYPTTPPTGTPARVIPVAAALYVVGIVGTIGFGGGATSSRATQAEGTTDEAPDQDESPERDAPAADQLDDEEAAAFDRSLEPLMQRLDRIEAQVATVNDALDARRHGDESRQPRASPAYGSEGAVEELTDHFMGQASGDQRDRVPIGHGSRDPRHAGPNHGRPRVGPLEGQDHQPARSGQRGQSGPEWEPTDYPLMTRLMSEEIPFVLSYWEAMVIKIVLLTLSFLIIVFFAYFYS